MKSPTQLDTAELDTILPGEGSSLPPDRASLPRMIRDYLGFEPAADHEPRGGRGSSARDFRVGSTLAPGRDDAETVWPGAETVWRGAGDADDPSAPAPAPAPRPDLQAAATVYLQAQARTDGDDRAATARPDAPALDPLFAELHRSCPADARRLAEGLTSLPTPGETFLGFHIVEELGRGAFGRVFLAHQGDLAGRAVALKVSAELPGESRTLAQLQHTNIVPIFSAHQSPPLHAVCMPYFGRATLADLLEGVEGQARLPASGRELVKVVHSRRSSSRPGIPSGSDPGSGSGSGCLSEGRAQAPLGNDARRPAPAVAPADPGGDAGSETLRRVGDLSYVDAVLWMGSRIADGLAHAHSRGILHRDLKPANVLMTDDGQPMILDFNLSEDTKAEVGASAASAGGTLRYMAPEHLERFLGADVAVDARGDVFALGVMLYELLTGRAPYEVYAGHSVRVLRQMIADRRAGSPPRLRPFNPAVSPAVESVVRRCLEADLGRRSGSAAEVHEDIERHLASLPLRHASEPSVRERAGKWLRRHPRVGSTSTVMAVAAVLLLGLAGAVVARTHRLARFEAASELARFRADAADVHFLLNPRVTDRAKRAQGQDLARRILGRYGVLDDPAWATRPAALALPPEDRGKLPDEVADVLLLLAQAKARDAAEQAEGPARRDLVGSARRLNGLALASFAPGREPQALWAQQAALARLLGREGEADRLMAEAAKRPLQTARDHYLAAAGLVAPGGQARAIPLAEEATRLDPQHFWSYFLLGVCHDQLDHHAEAMAYFLTCTALRPDFAESWLYRGIAYLKRNQQEQAHADFDRAAKLRPDWYEPPLHRALAERNRGHHLQAENDLTRALELGAPATRAYLLRAAERRALGDRRGADADLAEGLKREPTDVPGWISRGMARLESDPAAALRDFEGALKLDPRSLEAIQMSAYVLSDLPGRDEDAIRMLDRGVELYPDFVPLRSGRGVQLAILGRREEAHRDARESTWRDTSPAISYQVAGIYATTSKGHPEDRPEAYRLLASALRAGFGFDMIDGDRELDAIRDQPEFAAVVDSARAQAKGRLGRPPGR